MGSMAASKSETGSAIQAETGKAETGKSETSKPTPTNVLSPSSPSDPSTSPLVPIRHSRIVEKVELQNLNDRLAVYIDRMRFLENENARLNDAINTSTQTADRETATIKKMYENELSSTHKLVDELAMEKAKIQMDMKRLWEQNADLKLKYDKKHQEAQISEDAATSYASKYNETMYKYNAIVVEREKTVVDVENLKLEVAKLHKQVEECRKNLEEETVARVDSQNTIRSLREELKFKDQMSNGGLNGADITEIDSRLSEEHTAKLQESLQELRDQYEDQMRSNRDEIEILFETRMKNGQDTVRRDSKALNSALEYFCTRVDKSNIRIGELEQSNFSLNNQIRDLQFMLDGERIRSGGSEAEIKRFHEEMALQLERYQDLMDIKVSLDLEIAAYGKLLACEDHRLKIKPSVSRLSRSVSHTVLGSPAAKRNRNEAVYDYAVTSSSKGDMEIVEVDPAAKFVKLHNKSQNEVALGGWQLIQKTDGSETVHKFHCLDKIGGGADLIIWSADAFVSASSVNIIVDVQNWITATGMKTTLVNHEGQEQKQS